MHALMITFETSVPVEQLHQPFADYAQALRAISGLQMKTWVQDGNTVGGFHILSIDPARSSISPATYSAAFGRIPRSVISDSTTST